MKHTTPRACIAVRDVSIKSQRVSPAPGRMDHKAIVATWPKDMQDEWEERAAIMEHDGRLERSIAERNAFADVKTQMASGPRRQAH